jgi:hypothetical protein
MRAIVFKMAAHPSVEVARMAGEAAAEWAEAQGLEPVECFGGLVLGLPVGGINEWVIKYCTETGAKVIWLPALHAANHMMRITGCTLDEARARGGWWSLDERGRLLPEVADVFRYAGDHDIAVSFGHSAPEETQALAEEVYRTGFKKAFLDHPLEPVTGLTPDDLPAIADAGVHLNFTAFEISPWVALDPSEMAAVIKRLPVDRVVISTDAGNPVFPGPLESMRWFSQVLELEIPAETLRAAKIDNPRRLLNIDPVRS